MPHANQSSDGEKDLAQQEDDLADEKDLAQQEDELADEFAREFSKEAEQARNRTVARERAERRLEAKAEVRAAKKTQERIDAKRASERNKKKAYRNKMRVDPAKYKAYQQRRAQASRLYRQRKRTSLEQQHTGETNDTHPLTLVLEQERAACKAASEREKKRRYRDKLRLDPVKYTAYKELDAKRCKLYRQRKKAKLGQQLSV